MARAPAKDAGVPVKAAKTAVTIIDALRELNGAGVSELADHLGMPKSTVHDHLRTLEREEYLVNAEGEYRIGARFLELGGHARRQMKVYQIAKPEIQKLAQDTGEHANLMIEEHGHGIFLYKATGEDAVRLDTYAGMRVHLQTTALGKSMLANMPREAVEGILDRHGLPRITPKTVTDRDALFEELTEIRERGYAIDDEERVEGMRCVAAPITNNDGEPIAAVSVSGPKSRMQGQLFEEEVPNLVLRTANVIDVNLTYH